MKVLILSIEAWRDDKNGGNVLSNIFQKSDFEFAQIYCSPGSPSNNICKKYYQMTDGMILKNLLLRKTVGKKIIFDDFPSSMIDSSEIEQENKKIYKFFREHRFQVFYCMRELCWKISSWKNEEIKDFIHEFNPDIIFAPCHANHAMLRLARFVGELTDKPVISYVYDDVYTYAQFRVTPLYWLDRALLRRNIRKTSKLYKLVYTMTEEQKEQFENDLHLNMKLLRKAAKVPNNKQPNRLQNPIRIIYAGGIYLNRWKTLVEVSKAIKILNDSNQTKFVLDIYTGNDVPKKAINFLDDGVNSFIHKAISLEELNEEYSQSNIALHLESFDLKNRCLVRMSFSTKIVDCLESGCAVLAICDYKQAGWNYLKREKAAMCLSDKKEILPCLLSILEEPTRLTGYAKNAIECSRKKHNIDIIGNGIKEDFTRIYHESQQ